MTSEDIKHQLIIQKALTLYREKMSGPKNRNTGNKIKAIRKYDMLSSSYSDVGARPMSELNLRSHNFCWWPQNDKNVARRVSRRLKNFPTKTEVKSYFKCWNG